MLEFIQSLLSKFTIPIVQQKTEYLPPLVITEKMNHEFDKEYLEFICGLFVTSQKRDTLKQENQLWFSHEIARTLRKCYPNLSIQEYGALMQKLIDKDMK